MSHLERDSKYSGTQLEELEILQNIAEYLAYVAPHLSQEELAKKLESTGFRLDNNEELLTNLFHRYRDAHTPSRKVI